MQAVAVNLGVVGQHLIQVDHQTGAAAGLNDIGAAQITFVEILDGFTQAVCGVREIKCDTWRGIDRKPGWKICQWLFQSDLDDRHPIAGS